MAWPFQGRCPVWAPSATDYYIFTTNTSSYPNKTFFSKIRRLSPRTLLTTIPRGAVIGGVFPNGDKCLEISVTWCP